MTKFHATVETKASQEVQESHVAKNQQMVFNVLAQGLKNTFQRAPSQTLFNVLAQGLTNTFQRPPSKINEYFSVTSLKDRQMVLRY